METPTRSAIENEEDLCRRALDDDLEGFDRVCASLKRGEVGFG